METDTLKDTATAPTDIPGLVAQARAAYQQTRIKECLAITKALVLIDPGNAAAIQLQSAIRADMQRDLSDARALIEESRNKPEAHKYRKAAEIILLKALYLDPENEGAKTLLSSMRAVVEDHSAVVPEVPSIVAAPTIDKAPPAPTVAPIAAAAPVVEVVEVVESVITAPPAPVVAPIEIVPPAPVEAVVKAPPAAVVVEVAPPEPVIEHVEHTMPAAAFESAKPAGSDPYVIGYVTQPEPDTRDVIPFTTGAPRIEKTSKKSDKRSPITVPMIVVAIIVVGVGLLLLKQHFGSAPTEAATVAPAAATTTDNSNSVHTAPAPYPLAATAAQPATSSTNVTTNSQTKPAPAASETTPPLPSANVNAAAAPVNSRTNAAVAAATGSLAVSCAIPAEIYVGDKYVGSTPTTIQLPAGNQTVEYRNGDLRTVVTHAIKANETTTALITFNVVVQLTAKPWAQVYIDGATRTALGQTPVSDAKVPVGSVLVFENPNFPTKSHKVTVNDKTVQIQMANP